MTNTRLDLEIKQGRKIAEHAQDIWGWGSLAGRLRWSRRENFFASRIKPHARILEIGCGTGKLAARLSSQNCRLLCIDISWDLLKKAGVDSQNQKMFFSIQNASAMGIASAAFDMVIGNSILHHLELGKTAHEIYRVLKPGGEMIFFEPNMLNPQILLQKNIPWLKKMSHDVPHETAFFRWTLAGNLARVGFTHIRIRNIDFLHPATPPPLISLVQKISALMESAPFLKELSGSLLIEAKK